MTVQKSQKQEVIDKIINQANSLNKKIKKFKNSGINDHFDFIQAMFNDKQMRYNNMNSEEKTPSLTKSKKFYNEQNILQLKKTLNTLVKINNHDVFGTERKYKKYATDRWETFNYTIKQILLKKGYSEKEIDEITTRRGFHDALSVAFKDAKQYNPSDDVVEKVFLEFAEGVIEYVDIEKATSDIEHSIKRQDEYEKDLDDYMEYQRSKEERRKRRGRR